jgi:hypothetical protein
VPAWSGCHDDAVCQLRSCNGDRTEKMCHSYRPATWSPGLVCQDRKFAHCLDRKQCSVVLAGLFSYRDLLL